MHHGSAVRRHAGTFGGVAIADVNNDGTMDAVVQGGAAPAGAGRDDRRFRNQRRSRYRQSCTVVGDPDGGERERQDMDRQVNIGDRTEMVSTDGGDDIVVSIWTTGTSLGVGSVADVQAEHVPHERSSFPHRPPLPVSALRGLCFPVSGSPGDAAVVNLTPVEAGQQGLRPARVLRRPTHPSPPTSTTRPPPSTPTSPSPPSAGTTRSARQLAARRCAPRRRPPRTTIRGIAVRSRRRQRRARPQGRHTHRPRRRTIPPSGRVCFAVAGSPGDAAVVNLTPVEADGGGYGLLVSSDVASALRIQRQLRPHQRSTPTSQSHQSAATARSLRQLTPRLGATRRRPPRHHPRATPTSLPSRAAPPTARSTPASASAADQSHPPAGCASRCPVRPVTRRSSTSRRSKRTLRFRPARISDVTPPSRRT